MTPQLLTNWDTFVWGMAGASLAFSAIVIFPILRAKSESIPYSIQWIPLLAHAVLYVVGGGLFAVIMGDSTAIKHAAFYGVGWDALLKSLGVGVILGGQQIPKK